jgi:hypothetical protein
MEQAVQSLGLIADFKRVQERTALRGSPDHHRSRDLAPAVDPRLGPQQRPRLPRAALAAELHRGGRSSWSAPTAPAARPASFRHRHPRATAIAKFTETLALRYVDRASDAAGGIGLGGKLDNREPGRTVARVTGGLGG